jgi:hypothetical protein
MKNNGVGKYVAFAAFGFALLIAGLVLAISLPDAQGIMRTLPYICVGIGAGTFGGNLGAAISNHLLKKNPNLAKQKEIDTKDERNIAINNKAKAKAFDLMLMVYSALCLAFALMQVDMYVVLALVAAYLFVVFSMVYYLNKYHKEM